MSMRSMLLALSVLAGCAAEPASTVQTVAAVDLTRYSGRWYEVARVPNRFEDGSGVDCIEVTAEYTPRPDGTLAVLNSCRNAAADGALRQARGSAYAVAGSNNTKLRVSFFWPFYGDYWVVGLAPDYSWAVVGAPKRDYLWILSRTPALPATQYAAALATAQAQGFDLGKVKLTPQAAP